MTHSPQRSAAQDRLQSLSWWKIPFAGNEMDRLFPLDEDRPWQSPAFKRLIRDHWMMVFRWTQYLAVSFVALAIIESLSHPMTGGGRPETWLVFKVLGASLIIQCCNVLVCLRADQLSMGYAFGFGILWQFLRAVPVAMLYVVIPSSVIGMLLWERVPVPYRERATDSAHRDIPPLGYLFEVAGFWHASLFWDKTRRRQDGESQRDARLAFFSCWVTEDRARVFGALNFFESNKQLGPAVILIGGLFGGIFSLGMPNTVGLIIAALCIVSLHSTSSIMMWWPYSAALYRQEGAIPPVDSLAFSELDAGQHEAAVRHVRRTRWQGGILFGIWHLAAVIFVVAYTQPALTVLFPSLGVTWQSISEAVSTIISNRMTFVVALCVLPAILVYGLMWQTCRISPDDKDVVVLPERVAAPAPIKGQPTASQVNAERLWKVVVWIAGLAMVWLTAMAIHEFISCPTYRCMCRNGQGNCQSIQAPESNHH